MWWTFDTSLLDADVLEFTANGVHQFLRREQPDIDRGAPYIPYRGGGVEVRVYTRHQ